MPILHPRYDIFACRPPTWNTDSVQAVMERDKTDRRGRGYYFTIIRDPLKHFISLWDYYELEKLYGVSLETYAMSDKKGALQDRRQGFQWSRF